MADRTEELGRLLLGIARRGGRAPAPVVGVSDAAGGTGDPEDGTDPPFTNPMEAAGDMIAGGQSGAAVRLAVGTDGYVLTVVAGAPAWAAASSGSSGRWEPATTGDPAAPALYFDARGDVVMQEVA